ncbi:MAG: hypothetical protein Ta2E_02060 [Mycoplasmoidaceae bacterium]|nr:MAG: hypothetical protein Ta2E_02060 [Mycoplasmoidaceae bacterium]
MNNLLQNILIIRKPNIIYLLFFAHCIENNFSSCLFNCIINNFSPENSIQFLEIVDFIMKQIHANKKIELIDIFLSSELYSKFPDFSNEIHDDFRFALASFFQNFLLAMLNHETFYQKELQQASVFLLSHQFYCQLILLIDQYFSSDLVQLNSLRFKQIINLFSDVFKKAVNFQFQETSYATIVIKFWTQFFFGANLFLKILNL